MIAYIRGQVIKKTLSSIIIDINGLGYEVFVPTNYLDKYSQGKDAELYTHLYVREDTWYLYGFTSWEEKELFLHLINVSGIGPKVAVSILSHATLDQLRTAIASENTGFLIKLPGIGKKTAQRLVVELKEKMQDFVVNSVEISESVPTDSDVISALSVLGYQISEIKKIYPQLMKENPNADESTLIKKALQLLAKI